MRFVTITKSSYASLLATVVGVIVHRCVVTYMPRCVEARRLILWRSRWVDVRSRRLGAWGRARFGLGSRSRTRTMGICARCTLPANKQFDLIFGMNLIYKAGDSGANLSVNEIWRFVEQSPQAHLTRQTVKFYTVAILFYRKRLRV